MTYSFIRRRAPLVAMGIFALIHTKQCDDETRYNNRSKFHYAAAEHKAISGTDRSAGRSHRHFIAAVPADKKRNFFDDLNDQIEENWKISKWRVRVPAGILWKNTEDGSYELHLCFHRYGGDEELHKDSRMINYHLQVYAMKDGKLQFKGSTTTTHGED